ncbi:winged helix-turn-helix transcriptional regulator [Streptomyces europaeiscabiei]|uniref:winged helix-turn-helix transcriptional regulator n=1 Tax=Streptomyces europaeiscabiei TaxID=146819 RepID=UPI0038F76DC6
MRQTLDRLGDKWSLPVIGTLHDGPLRHSELRHAVPGISQRMLTLTLRQLQRHGLVTRTAHGEVPRRRRPSRRSHERLGSPGAVTTHGHDPSVAVRTEARVFDGPPCDEGGDGDAPPALHHCSKSITSLSNTRKSMSARVDIGWCCGYGFSRSPERQKGLADTNCRAAVRSCSAQDGAVVEFRSHGCRRTATGLTTGPGGPQ